LIERFYEAGKNGIAAFTRLCHFTSAFSRKALDCDCISPIWLKKRQFKMIFMETKNFMYYQDDDMFIGWLDDFLIISPKGQFLRN
jgi:hypothetical protein